MAILLLSSVAGRLSSQPCTWAAASTASIRYGRKLALLNRILVLITDHPSEARRYQSSKSGKNVFVLNCGSSSIKYQLLQVQGEEQSRVICKGMVERIGQMESPITHKKVDPNSDVTPSTTFSLPLKDHGVGLREIAKLIFPGDLGNVDLYAIGHRVVHGGEKFAKSVLIDGYVMKSIEDNIVLAPLHNPGNLMGIEVAKSMFPKVPQVACFDTSFHQTMPPHAYIYPINYEHYKKERIRRYGFHGTSHAYVANQAAKLLQKPLAECNLITLHIGNGGSVAAIQNGKVIDTSMGLTPLEGLMMGTRCGDVDASIPMFLESHGYTSSQVSAMLTRESGLVGICGHSDFRDVLKGYSQGEPLCTLAFNMYVYRIKKYIGSYTAALNGKVDALVFTAGLGENSDLLREKVMVDLKPMGISLDLEKNGKRNAVLISTEASPTKIMVIPTDEEAQIAYESVAAVDAAAEMVKNTKAQAVHA